jgi:hypothetical protein
VLAVTTNEHGHEVEHELRRVVLVEQGCKRKWRLLKQAPRWPALSQLLFWYCPSFFEVIFTERREAHFDHSQTSCSGAPNTYRKEVTSANA